MPSKDMSPKIGPAPVRMPAISQGSGTPPVVRVPVLQEPIEVVVVRIQLELETLTALKKQKDLIQSRETLRKLDQGSEEELIARLQDSNPWIRCGVAARIGDKRLPAVKDLIPLLADTAVEVQDAAHRALVRLAHGTDLGPNFQDSSAKVQQAIERWNTWVAAQETPLPHQASPAATNPDLKSVPVPSR
jgi:hypothetical protein